MLILAFDTTMAACSVAVWRDGETLAHRHQAMVQGQAEALAPMIAAAMDDAKVAFDALDRVAVTIGPGSFTGVRVGLAAARGFGLACKIPVIGATTGEVLARRAGGSGTVVSLVDTKRGDLYVEAFRAEGGRLLEPNVIGLEEIAQLSARGWPKPLSFVGDGVSLAGETTSRVFPEPALLAEIAATRDADPAGPLPVYVRPPAVTVAS